MRWRPTVLDRIAVTHAIDVVGATTVVVCSVIGGAIFVDYAIGSVASVIHCSVFRLAWWLRTRLRRW